MRNGKRNGKKAHESLIFPVQNIHFTIANFYLANAFFLQKLLFYLILCVIININVNYMFMLKIFILYDYKRYSHFVIFLKEASH